MKKVLITAASFLLIASASAQAGGDAEAGAATFENVCSECHYEDDFTGESAEDIAGMIKAVVAGETEHDEDLSSLSAEDIANVAAYFASQ